MLIVDDDPQVANLIADILASRGYEVRTTNDVDSAMSLLDGGWRPDVIITDLEMPHVDGFELCRRVRETSNVPIIVVSGHNDGRWEVAALDAGADDYVMKPFSTDTLLARLRVALRHSVEPPPVSVRDPELRNSRHAADAPCDASPLSKIA
jgi:two-component system KDP operon response regulator KdpE